MKQAEARSKTSILLQRSHDFLDNTQTPVSTVIATNSLDIFGSPLASDSPRFLQTLYRGPGGESPQIIRGLSLRHLCLHAPPPEKVQRISGVQCMFESSNTDQRGGTREEHTHSLTVNILVIFLLCSHMFWTFYEGESKQSF